MIAFACMLLFSASIAWGQAAPSAAPSAPQARTQVWKVHGIRGNQPVYRRSGEILVEYRAGAKRDLSQEPGLASMIRGKRVARGDIEAITFDEDAVGFDAIRDRLLAAAGVRRVEPNLVLSTQQVLANPRARADYASKQWHLDPDRRGRARSPRDRSQLMRRLGSRAPRGEATRVGVVDTGVDYDHIEFAGRTLPGVNLLSHPYPDEDPASEGDQNGHGTMVAGVIAAADDGAGVLGIDPRAEICSIKAFNRDGDGYLEDIIAGIDWAIANGIQVINLSFGTYEYSALLEEAILRAQSAGILVVAAAGNDAADTAMFPAAFAGVLSVGAHDQGGATSLFSNWGSDVDFHAPGDRLLTTDLWHDGISPYTVFTGTSAAAAYATGIASLLIENGESADSAATLMRENVIARPSDRHVRPEPDRWLNDRLIMARLLGEQYAETTIVSFTTDRKIFAHADDVTVRYAIQNTGTRRSPPTPAWLVVQEGDVERRIALGSIPRLAPGEHHAASSVIAASQLLALPGSPGSGPDGSPHRLRVELALDDFPLATAAPQRLLINDEPIVGVGVRAMWVSPLDFNDADVERTLYATAENAGRTRVDDLVARVYAVNAVHEGVGRAPKTDLGTISIGSLMPGEIIELQLPLTGFEPPAKQVTFWMEIEHQGQPLIRTLQGYRYPRTGGSAKPEYAWAVHRDIAEQAVQLLEDQGIYLPDLAPGSLYRGSPNIFNTWPESAGLPTATLSDPNYWTDADLASGAASLGLQNFTMIDGANDADGVDIAFGYSFEDNFDSHFWIVDNFDDDGLDSGSNHHSALSKLRAILYGPDPSKGVPADNQLAHGAIDHYNAGYKQAAWWFIGHAVHLIGDLSVPSHVNDENYHGFWGATYHDWMDKGNNDRWDFSDAAAQGGFVNPYSPATLGDPVRYLAYTTAQIGNAFPYAETNFGSQDGFKGNRTAGGNSPHYDAAMQTLFATLPPRPIEVWHVNKDEVWDSFTPFDNCQLVDFVGLTESRRDCWGGGDGHIDYDNTDDDNVPPVPGNKNTETANDSDGDLTRIATVNYPYAIRAAAGLIYYFAVETGQLAVTVSNTNDSGPGSLREAIALSPPGNLIEFDPSLSGATITLSGGSDGISIGKNLTIDASGLASGLTLDGNGVGRIFSVSPGVDVDLIGLEIRNGSQTFGGGILNSGNLSLVDVTIEGNHATSFGGGIWNSGQLSIADCTFENNHASRGAALMNSGAATIERSTLSGNVATSQGGGIFHEQGYSLTLVNTTMSGNHADESGGALQNRGIATLIHSTVSGNTASLSAGGIGNVGGFISIENSIVAGNGGPGPISGPDIENLFGGQLYPNGANLIGDNDTVSGEFPAGPLVGTASAPLDPLLLGLAPNGGPTRTLLPLGTSPAVDAAVATANTPATDQRGVSRPRGPASDLGAVELPGPPTVSSLQDSAIGAPLIPGSLREMIANASTGATILFDAALSGGTIALSSGDLVIDKDLTLDASALPAGVKLDGMGLDRIFTIDPGAHVSLIGLELRNGSTTTSGGAIHNSGTLTLADCTVEANHANDFAGGLYNNGSTTIERCTFSGNTANDSAALWNSPGRSLTLVNTTVSGNHAVGNGGAMLNYQGNATLIHATISGNTAGNYGGGIDNDSGTVSIENSIVAGNSGPPPGNAADIGNRGTGSVVASGNNLIGDNESVGTVFPQGALVGTRANPKDPMLLPLGNYGGPTRTMMLVTGSPAVDAALPTANSPATDQRGVARPVGPAADLGATESDILVVFGTHGLANGMSLSILQNEKQAGGAAFLIGGSIHSPSGAPDLFFRAGSTPTFPGPLDDYVEWSISGFESAPGVWEPFAWEGAVSGSDNWMKLIRDGDGAVSWAQFVFDFAPGAGSDPILRDVLLYVSRADGADLSLAEAVAAVPEPGLGGGLMAGLALLLGLRRRGRAHERGVREGHEGGGRRAADDGEAFAGRAHRDGSDRP